MVAIVTPVGGGSAQPLADNERGQISGLAPAGIQTIVSGLVGSRRLRGFSVHASVDGEAWVEVDGIELDGIHARFSRALQAYLPLPSAEAMTPTSTVALVVQNTGIMAGDFEGTLFLEAGT